MSAPETPSGPRYERALQWVLVVGFLVGIATPGAKLLVRPELERIEADIRDERRRAEPTPEWPATLAELEALPDRVDAWFGDFFGFRTTLIRWHAIASLFWLGDEPNDRIVLGEEMWMFLRHERSLADYRGLAPFTEAELDAWQAAIEARRDWFAATGGEYLFVVAPNKSTIYPEYLPDRFTVVGERRRLDQLYERLRERTTVRAVDLRPALLAAKRHTLVYYERGTHWNRLGAYYAYAEIVRRMAEVDPTFAPYPLESFDVTWKEGPGDSWTPTMHIGDLLLVSFPRLRRVVPPYPRLRRSRPAWVEREAWDRDVVEILDAIATRGSDPPVGLFAQDSFGKDLRRPLAAHFESLVVLINGRSAAEDFVQAARHHRPTWMIDEIVERSLTEQPEELLFPLGDPPPLGGGPVSDSPR